jgi:uncharacterized sporulation protein YeaH/YhbH (DUF444 family)
MIRHSFPPEDYNLYPFHFSDGDNFSDDDERALNLLSEILPLSNLFCYGQVETVYGSGSFMKSIQGRIDGDEKMVVAQIRGRESIFEALQSFLGTGR